MCETRVLRWTDHRMVWFDHRFCKAICTGWARHTRGGGRASRRVSALLIDFSVLSLSRVRRSPHPFPFSRAVHLGKIKEGRRCLRLTLLKPAIPLHSFLCSSHRGRTWGTGLRRQRNKRTTQRIVYQRLSTGRTTARWTPLPLPLRRL